MANAQGMPFKMVLDKAHDTPNVTITPMNTQISSQTVACTYLWLIQRLGAGILLIVKL